MVCSKCGKVIDYYEVVISPRTWLKGFPLFKFYLKEIFVKNSMMWFSIIFLYIIADFVNNYNLFISKKLTDIVVFFISMWYNKQNICFLACFFIIYIANLLL